MEQKHPMLPSQVCVISEIWSLKNSCLPEIKQSSKPYRKNIIRYRTKKRGRRAEAQKKRRRKERESKCVKEEKSNTVPSVSKDSDSTLEQSSLDIFGSLAEDVEPSRSSSPNNATNSLSEETKEIKPINTTLTLHTSNIEYSKSLDGSLSSLKGSIPTKSFSPSMTYSLNNSPSRESISTDSFQPSTTHALNNLFPSEESIPTKSFSPSMTYSLNNSPSRETTDPFQLITNNSLNNSLLLEESILTKSFLPSTSVSLKTSPSIESISTNSFQPSPTHSLNNSLPSKESIPTKSPFPSMIYLLNINNSTSKESISTNSFPQSTTHSLKNLPLKESISTKSSPNTTYSIESRFPPSRTYSQKDPISSIKKIIPIKPLLPNTESNSLPALKKSVSTKSFPKKRTKSAKKSAPSPKGRVSTKRFPPTKVKCDIGHVISQARKLEKHTNDCKFGGEMIQQNVEQNGFIYIYNFKCDHPCCTYTEKVTTFKLKKKLLKL